MKLVSIIVPVFEVEQYLEKCLASISNQSYRNIEIICVNGRTMDNSVTLIKQAMRHDSRIKLINQSVNDGLGGSRNEGLRHAQGEYIQFVDSDDWIDREMTATLVAALEKYDADYSFCALEGFDDRSGASFGPERPFHSKWSAQICMDGLFDLENYRNVLTDIYPSAWLALRRRELALQCSFPTDQLAEDHKFHYEYGFRSKSAVYVDKFLYRHRRNRRHQLSLDATPRSMQVLQAIEGNFRLFDQYLTEEEALRAKIKIAVRLGYEKIGSVVGSPAVAQMFFAGTAALLKQFDRDAVLRYADEFVSIDDIAVLLNERPHAQFVKKRGLAVARDAKAFGTPIHFGPFEIPVATKTLLSKAPSMRFGAEWADIQLSFDQAIDLSRGELRMIVFVDAPQPIQLRHAFLCGSYLGTASGAAPGESADANVLEFRREYRPGFNLVSFDIANMEVLRGDPNPAKVSMILFGGAPGPASVNASFAHVTADGVFNLSEQAGGSSQPGAKLGPLRKHLRSGPYIIKKLFA